MPHKHKGQKPTDSSSYDLPPTSLAKTLPTRVFSSPKFSVPSRSPAKGIAKRSKQTDDTPRAFTRLLAYKEGHRPPSGLDNGFPRKKPKIDAPSPVVTSITEGSSAMTSLQRLPHESMSAFSQRVNAALPISGLAKSRPSGSSIPSIKGLKADGTKQTRMEKKMQKMQKEWREAKKRRDETMQDANEEQDDESPGEISKGKGTKGTNSGNPLRKSTKRHRHLDDDDDEDPWAELNARKLASIPSIHPTNLDRGLVGLHDVVVAPPKLSAPRKIFRDTTKDIPKAAGSLRRREELAKARMAVLSAMSKKGHSP